MSILCDRQYGAVALRHGSLIVTIPVAVMFAVSMLVSYLCGASLRGRGKLLKEMMHPMGRGGHDKKIKMAATLR